MTRLIGAILFLAVAISAAAQGPVRYFDTLAQLLQFNPYASATAGSAVYEVGRPAAGQSWGRSRAAIWTASTNAAPNGTNVFASPFGGRWIFYDRDDPIQNARWYGLTNRWGLDHLGNLTLGSTNVAQDLAELRSLIGDAALATDLSDYALLGHDHPVVDLRDATPLTRAMLQESAPDGLRAILLLGNSATRNVGTTTNDVASGQHQHDGLYDALGTAATLISQHSGQTNPHAVYIMGANGSGTNLTVVGGTISGTVALSLGSDVGTSGDHRLLVREASSGKWSTMDRSYFRGWLDLHASNIVDSGTAGVHLLQSANATNALDVLGSGRVGSSLFLRSDGTWSTAINTNYTTNSLPEAPNDGGAYARKNEAWTGLAIADVSGLTSFGSFWVTDVDDSVDALTTLALVGGGAATLDSPAKYVVRANSSGSGVARHRLNVIPGTAISITLADDSVDDESDVTIAVSNLLAVHIADSSSVGRSILVASNEAAIRTILQLGTASTRDVPSSGNALTNQVVLGSDTRLTNSRTPVAHEHALADLPLAPSWTFIGNLDPLSDIEPQYISIQTLRQWYVTEGILGTGDVSSVSLAMPGVFTVSGSPVTNSGTITVGTASQPAGYAWMGPVSGVAASPTFRRSELSDLPSGTWTVSTDGSGSGLDADLLDGQHGLYYLDRANQTGVMPWSALINTPTNRAGYGILDAAASSDLAAHIANSVLDGSRPHGVGEFGGILAASSNRAAAQSLLLLGSAAYRNVPGAGNASNTIDGAQVVIATDTRLADSRAPTAHGHVTSNLTNVASQTVVGRVTAGTGNAEEIPIATLASAIAASGGGPTGTVRSVALGTSFGSIFQIPPTVITNTGTLTIGLQPQLQGLFLGSPESEYGFPTYRRVTTNDLQAYLWSSVNDGADSTLDAGLFEGQDGSYYLNRSNHTGTQDWATVSGKPTTVDGYGITDALKLSGGTLTGELVGTSANFTNGVRITIPTRKESATSLPFGISAQTGSGVADSNGWTYINGTKLSLRTSAGSARQWELVNTHASSLSPTGSMAFRIGGYVGGGGWAPWRVLLDDQNYGNYSPSKSGTGATGTWNISIGGNAATATSVPWGGVTSKPTTKSGYGITDVPTYTDLAAHTNLTAGAHGISSFGSTLVDDASASAARTTLGLGTAAVLNAPASGDAASGEAVKGNDTRLTNARTPTAHTHPVSDISDSGATGRLLVQSANKTNALNVLGSGGAPGLYLTWDGWATAPSYTGPTNVLGEAPTNGLMYGRKNAAWTQVSMADISGMSVGLTVPAPFSVSGSPVTSSGTLAVAVSNQVQKTFWAGPVSGANAPPGFRVMELTDLPAGIDAATLDGNDTPYYLNRTNHTGTQAWSTIHTTPTTKSGYGLTDVPSYSDLAAHTNLTVGAHGITAFGSTVAGASSAAVARTNLGLGTSATLNVASSGNAATNEVVKGDDTRLTDPRDPLAHTQDFSTITSTPTTKSGYGITDVPTYSDLAAHTNLTAGAHGISAFGATLVDDTSASSARSTLGLGTSATLNVAASGNAATNEVVKGNDTRLSDARTPTAHTQAFSTITSTPTTKSGYGITDVPTYSDLAAHTNLTAGAHGISSFGATLVDDASASAARTTLGLGSAAVVNVPASGNAAASEAVKGGDTRLSDARTPTSHNHQTTHLTNVASKVVVGRITPGTGTAEQITLSNLVAALQTDGGLGSASVSSVGLSMPSIFSVSGSPVTSSGTLTASPCNPGGRDVFRRGSNGLSRDAVLQANRAV
jgi:hypothetical protein